MKGVTMKLDGAAALVTGASRGLGEELAVALARKGVKVVLVARDAKELSRVQSRIESEGGTAFVVAADVADKDSVYRVAGAAAAAAGPIDLLVHNAGTLGPVPLELLLDTDCEDLERAFAVNVLGPFRLTKAIAGAMALRGRGTVVGVTTDAAVNAYETWGAYGVTKAALEHLLRSFAAELGKQGVRFLAVDPGEMDTVMHRDALPDADPATLSKPSAIAARLVALLERPERDANGGGATRYARAELGGAS
jgi:NAD(P)-dependent dehydrogenase (short-subunit alcohol dehydrogenase family)